MEVAAPNGQSAVIDLGIADPERVRGWSGGARTEFMIGTREATPGYLAGAIAPGTWSVLLGAYRIPEDGCMVTLFIELQPAAARWLKGDLHVHTFHSDGVYSPQETVDLAKDIGLDFLAFTDHNTVSQNRVFLETGDLIVIPGMELTTYNGHANLLGSSDPLHDFRVASQEELYERAEEAHLANAKIVINHPHDDTYPGCKWGYGFDWEFDWIEVWNGPWRPYNQLTLEWWQQQLASGKRLVAVGGSDTHRPHPYVCHGMPTNWVFTSDHTAEGILAAINDGKVFISFSPQGPTIDLRCGFAMMGSVVSRSVAQDVEVSVAAANPGDRVRIVTELGTECECVVRAGETQCAIAFDARERLFCRVEVWRYFEEVQQTLMAGLCNPIYFR